MIKKGFTLQELLISLAIVGVVAAITVPGIIGMMPDKKKAMYMKCYSTLTSLTNEILDDPTLYSIKYDDDGEPEEDAILKYTDEPIEYQPCLGAWSCTGNSKFPAIFATKVNYISREIDGNTARIRTSDGVLWTFVSAADLSRTAINIDLEPDGGNNCTYNEDCSDPDQFTFGLFPDGEIIAVDRLGQAFLRNPTDYHSVKKDKELADTLEVNNRAN